MASAVIAGQDPVATARLLATEARAGATVRLHRRGARRRQARRDEPLRARRRRRRQVGVRTRWPTSSGGTFSRTSPCPASPGRTNASSNCSRPARSRSSTRTPGWSSTSPAASRSSWSPAPQAAGATEAALRDAVSEARARRHRALPRHQGRDAAAGAGARTRPAALGDERRDARHDDPDVCQRHARRPEADRLQERRGLPGRGPLRRAVPLRPGRPSERRAPGQHHRGHGLRDADADRAPAVPGHPPRRT